METIDLSKLTLDISGDRSFDKRDVKGALNYLKEIRDNSTDYVVKGEHITIKEVDDEKWQLWAETPEGVKVFTPTSYATRQTITKTPLPKTYHDTLVEKGHINEAVKHLNLWLHEDDAQRIRAVGNQYRALVSPSYGAFDNYDIFASAAGVIKTTNMMRGQENKPAQFYRADISEEHMYLNIIDFGRQFDVGKGDLHYPLITIRNSEVGGGAFEVDAGFFRGMCENRMLTGIINRRIHRMDKLDAGTYSMDTLQAQASFIVKMVRDQMGAAFTNDQFFDNIATNLRDAKELKLDNTQEAVEKVGGILKLSDDEENDILNAMLGDQTILPEDRGTAFALINGITLVEKTKGIERGMELTTGAGKVKEILKVLA